MTGRQISLLTLAGALLLALVIHLADFPEGKSNERLSQHSRDRIIAQYLIIKESPNTDFKTMVPFLESFEKQSLEPRVAEAIILCYGLEGDAAKARQLSRTYSHPESLAPVKYALNIDDQLPENWKSMLVDDWAGAKTTSLIYERKGMDQEFAESLISLRHYESKLRRDFKVGSWNMMLCVFGAGLLFSMWLSARQWRRLGENFFRLLPLPLPTEVLIRFFGLFLLGFMVVGVLVEQTMGSFSTWTRHIVSYMFQMAWGLYLIRKKVFRGNLDSIAETLGFSNLKMRFVSIFQIFGALAILVFLNAVTGFMEEFVLHWPQTDFNLAIHYSTLFENPVVAVIFLFVSCILGPIFEEVMFRGLIMRGLMARMSASSAICLSAMCFAILHPLANWPAVMLMGVGLGIVYYRTSNLLVNIWAHAAWNGLVIWLSYIGAVY